jgi:hypothetical protein
MFLITLQIIQVPIRIWDLQIGGRFCLEPNGWNFTKERFEIYLKITRTKCLLDSVPEKPKFSIPNIANKDVGYKVIEVWSRNLPKQKG